MEVVQQSVEDGSDSFHCATVPLRVNQADAGGEEDEEEVDG